MSQIWAIAYVSTATDEPSDAALERLLSKARAFNSEVGVTGALLVHGSTFFQYFEGPKKGVEAVYARVKMSRAHKDIVELFNESVEQRTFPSWLMGFANAPRSVILQLEQAQWRAVAANGHPSGGPTLALGLVLDFWKNAHGGQRG